MGKEYYGWTVESNMKDNSKIIKRSAQGLCTTRTNRSYIKDNGKMISNKND